MNCSQVSDVLSDYYDGELESTRYKAVADHLSQCEACSQRLAGFKRLSVLTKELSSPPVPERIWEQLRKELAARESLTVMDVASTTGRRKVRGVSIFVAFVGIAAAILVGLFWNTYLWKPHEHDDHQMAAVFGQYLEEFHRDPMAAQRILLTNYAGQAVETDEVAALVGYRPAIADGLPKDYEVNSVYVMKMPCCTCVQCLCQRSDGTTIAIFEHEDAKPNWFGHRRETSRRCSGTNCSVVNLAAGVAVTWRRGNRHVTVIDHSDSSKVDELVAWFNSTRPAAELVR